MEARFSAPVQTGPGTHPASFTVSAGSFPKIERPGRGVNRPPPSNAEIKERVELYLYSPSGHSWPVIRRTLPLYIYIYIYTHTHTHTESRFPFEEEKRNNLESHAYHMSVKTNHHLHAQPSISQVPVTAYSYHILLFHKPFCNANEDSKRIVSWHTAWTPSFVAHRKVKFAISEDKAHTSLSKRLDSNFQQPTWNITQQLYYMTEGRLVCLCLLKLALSNVSVM